MTRTNNKPPPCRNCMLFGRKALATIGHACIDVDCCERCGQLRILRVIAVTPQGGVTRERECDCSRQRQKAREAADVRS